MKTRVLSALGALAMGALAVGCSAETGPQGSGDPSVGETRSPLVLADMTAARVRAASCVVTDSNSIDHLIVYGGESAVGTEANATYMYDPAANSWSTGPALYNTNQTMPSLTNAKMLKIPGTSKCLLTGGSTSGTATASAFIFDWNGGSPTYASTGAMAVSRTQFKLIPCGTGGKILAIGGRSTEAGGTARDTIEVYDPTAGTWSAFAGASKLSAARSELAVASLDTNFTKILVAGGLDGAGAQSNKIDLVTTTTACGSQTISATTTVLATARENAAAFPTGATNEFYVIGGSSNGTNSLDSTEKVTVDWAVPNNTAKVAGTAMTSKRQKPQVALYASGNRWAVVGGLDTTPNPDVALNKAQVWDPFGTPTWATETTFDTARYDAVVEYLPSEGRIFIVGGQNVTPTVLAKTESL